MNSAHANHFLVLRRPLFFFSFAVLVHQCHLVHCWWCCLRMPVESPTDPSPLLSLATEPSHKSQIKRFGWKHDREKEGLPFPLSAAFIPRKLVKIHSKLAVKFGEENQPHLTADYRVKESRKMHQVIYFVAIKNAAGATTS